jgi:hypothetical protein
MAAKRCYVCGREGVRGFCHVPEVTVQIAERFGGGETVVGGWDECANKDACRRRIAAAHRLSGHHPESEYP